MYPAKRRKSHNNYDSDLNQKIDRSKESNESQDQNDDLNSTSKPKSLHDQKNLDVKIQRKNTLFHSAKSFEEFHLKSELLKGVYAMGFNFPSKIQEITLPTLLSNPPQNMIVQSQSGTGKTCAFVLAMLNRVDTKENYPQVICLSPTYELAVQTYKVAVKMARYCPQIKLKLAVKGERFDGNRMLNDHIVIGTPGKMLQFGFDYRILDLKKIKMFVLDEGDNMISTQGHHEQCLRLHKQLTPSCQMILFSATYEKETLSFAQFLIKNPVTITLLRDKETLENIKQYYVKCSPDEDKYTVIKKIFGNITTGKAIIFCHTKSTARWLNNKLINDGHLVALLSGDMSITQRCFVMEKFRDGSEKIVIATDVLSRGIDVAEVTIVINFDLPVDVKGNADCESYLHRIGRSGRFGKEGIAISIVNSPKDISICKTIEEHFRRPIKLLNLKELENLKI